MAGQLWKYDSIRGLYHMEGNGVDSSGNGNIITHNGTTTVAGKLGDAQSYTTDDYSTANGLIDDLANDTTGTVAFWAYLDVDNGASQWLYGVSEIATANRSDFSVIANFNSIGNPLQIACVKDGVTQYNLLTTTTNLDTLVGSWACFIIKHNGTEISEIKINNVSQARNFLTSTVKASWMKAIITDATTKADTVGFGAANQVGSWVAFLEGGLDEVVTVGALWDSDDDDAFWNNGAGRVISDPSRQRFIGKRPELTVDRQIIGNRGNPIIR